MRLLAVAVCCVLSASACSEGQQACTLIGCEDQLTLVVSRSDGTTATTFTGSVVVNGQTFTFECSPEGSPTCLDGTVRIGTTPPDGTIHVTIDGGAGGSFDDDVAVDPETFRPNGPGCPPECTQAEVAIRLR